MPVFTRAALIGAFTLYGAVAQAVTVTQTFDPSINLDDGPGTVAFTLVGLNPNVESDLTIDFTFFGDLNGTSENFELFLDGASYGVGCDNNSGNDNFGINRSNGGGAGAADRCSQARNSLTDASVLVSAIDAIGLLADGALDIVFNFSSTVNDFVDIRNGGETRSGVFFGNVENASFGAGGTVIYQASELASPVPVPPALPMLGLGVGALALLRRRTSAG
ncbi:MAG: VPLPA-CTERM sorting domain-containing protein [Pseudomonadota bacterium]